MGKVPCAKKKTTNNNDQIKIYFAHKSYVICLTACLLFKHISTKILWIRLLLDFQTATKEDFGPGIPNLCHVCCTLYLSLKSIIVMSKMAMEKVRFM